MSNKKISELAAASSLGIGDLFETLQGGVNKKVTLQLLSPNRGDYAGTTEFPSTGGRGLGGAPIRGDRWRLTDTLTIGGTDVYSPGTIIEAAIDSPGQTTANWIKYAVQP